MMRASMVTLMVLATTFCVFSEKTEKHLVLIKEWNDQRFLDETGSAAPLLFDDANQLYKVDPDEAKLRIYDSRFKQISEVVAPFTFMGAELRWSGFGGLFYKKDIYLFILRIDGKVSPQRIAESHIENGHLLVSGLLVIEDENGKLRGYLQPESAGGTARRLDDSEVRTYVKTNAAGLNGLTLDSEGVPLFRGIPWSKSGFRKYWGLSIGYFNAVDRDLNTYYNGEIRDKAGKVIETFAFNPGLMSNLTLDHEGNVFVMRGFRAYYIGRDWGFPSNRAGILNDDKVRVRLHPGTGEIILGQVDKGVAIIILEQTPDSETIDGTAAPWYKVKLPNGLVGWVFGRYVDVQK